MLSTRGYFRPDTGRVQQHTIEHLQKTGQNGKGELNRTVRSSSRDSSSKLTSSSGRAVRAGVQDPSQSSRLLGPGRRVGPVGPKGIEGIPTAVAGAVEDDPSELPVLSGKL
jgi:hypothetical protein